MPHIVLVIPDRPALVHRMRILEDAGFSVSGHTQPEEVINCGTNAGADLVIVDTSLPRMGAGALMRRLRDVEETPVLAMIDARNDLDEVRYLNDGAADVVESSAQPEILIARVRAVLRRSGAIQVTQQDSVLDQPTLRAGPLFMQPSTLMVRWFDRSIEFTKTEFRILYALAAYPEVIRTRNFLQDLVYGDDIHVIDRAIDSHIKRVRQKLRNANPDFEGILTVYGLGYRFRLPTGRDQDMALAG